MAPYIQELERLSPLVDHLHNSVRDLDNLPYTVSNLKHTVEELDNTVKELKLKIEEIEKANKPYEIIEVEWRRGRHGLHRI